MGSLSKWPWETPPPGLYFNMSFEEYLGIKCLNASGTKDLDESPASFWISSWMNQYKKKSPEKPHFKIGKFYHKRILEGRDIFFRDYAPAFEYDPEDKSIIDTIAQIKGELMLRRQPTTFGNKDEGIARLLKVNPEAKILCKMQEDHYKKWGKDKIFIEADHIRFVTYCLNHIEASNDYKGHISGGYPEVTIIWDDPDFGVRYKIRVDYMKIFPFVDLKTISNPYGMKPELAVKKALKSLKYTIQAGLYLKGMPFARKFAAEGKVYGADGINPEWIKTFSEAKYDEFWFLFIFTEYPAIQGANFSLKDPISSIALRQIEDAAKLFIKNYEEYGERPWPDISKPFYIHADEVASNF